MRQSFLFAVSGVKNSGKTTLIKRVLPILNACGLNTAVIKHDGHDFSADVPGTDTYSHLKAGAYGTAVFSDKKFMLVKYQKNISEQDLKSAFPEADIILLEGFKHSRYPKIEVMRKEVSEEVPVCACNVVAIMADYVPKCKKDVPVLDIDNVKEAAQVILEQYFIKRKLSMVILAGGKSRRMGADKADLLFGDQTFLQYQIEKGRMLGIQEIIISGYHGTKGCEAQIVKDRYPDCGPLGGLESALRESSEEYSLTVPVDMPKVTTGTLRQIIRDFVKKWMTDKDIKIMPVAHRGRLEPLLGIYSSELSGSMENAILSGQNSVSVFLKKEGYTECTADVQEDELENINSPEMYLGLLKDNY